MSTAAKAELRTDLRRRLRAMGGDERRDGLGGRVLALPQWSAAACVLLYAPLADEPDLLALLGECGRTFCVPRIESPAPPTLAAVAVTGPPGDDLPGWRRGPFGLWEPAGEALDPARIDLVLVPGLAFTRDGRRLGRGKGFYDRFLPTLRPDCFKCGVCFDLQLVDALPTEPHDVRLDAVLTPRGLWRGGGACI